MLTVEQVDRDAAIVYARGELQWSGYRRNAVQQGQNDDHPLVQAFAAHRIAALEEAARVRDLHQIGWGTLTTSGGTIDVDALIAAIAAMKIPHADG